MPKILLIGLFSIGVLGCKKDRVDNKIVDGLPIGPAQAILPAQAAQQMLLLKRGVAGVIIPVINKLGLANQTFTELSGPDAQSRYAFSLSNNRFGSASYSVQFRNASDVTIDPISARTSTTTLASVVITGSGSSQQFTYSESLRVTLKTAGNTTSDKFLTGSSNFAGGTYNLTFTLPSPGPKISFEGLIDGYVAGAGSNAAGQAASLNLIFASDLTASGPLTWEGRQGGLYIRKNGEAFVTTEQSRIIVE